MAEFPALPLWTDAYIADCAHLTFAEHGAYLSLLLLMWRSPECRVPNDDDWIMRKLRCDADAMRTHVRSVMREFCEVDGNWITQKRLRKEWVWCRDKRKKNTDAAKSRWGKETKQSERNANGYANGMPPYPSLTLPLPKQPKKKEIAASAVLPDWLPKESWEGFKEMRSNSRYPLKGRSETLALKELSKLRDEGHDPAAVLDHSTMKGYRGLFPPPPAGTNGQAKHRELRYPSDSPMIDTSKITMPER